MLIYGKHALSQTNAEHAECYTEEMNKIADLPNQKTRNPADV